MKSFLMNGTMSVEWKGQSLYIVCFHNVCVSAALSSTVDLETLVKEVSTMLSFKHENVMSLIGVCVDGEMPLLIMPFMSNGSVLDYVRKHKDQLLITGRGLETEVCTITQLLSS